MLGYRCNTGQGPALLIQAPCEVADHKDLRLPFQPKISGYRNSAVRHRRYIQPPGRSRGLDAGAPNHCATFLATVSKQNSVGADFLDFQLPSLCFSKQ